MLFLAVTLRVELVTHLAVRSACALCDGTVAGRVCQSCCAPAPATDAATLRIETSVLAHDGSADAVVSARDEAAAALLGLSPYDAYELLMMAQEEPLEMTVVAQRGVVLGNGEMMLRPFLRTARNAHAAVVAVVSYDTRTECFDRFIRV